jgi:hypothetical protein
LRGQSHVQELSNDLNWRQVGVAKNLTSLVVHVHNTIQSSIGDSQHNITSFVIMKVLQSIIIILALSVMQASASPRRRGLSKGGKGKGDGKKSASPSISLSPSSAPSISNAPSVSSMPSASSLPSNEPSFSTKPSSSPSESFAPSQSLAPSCGSKKGKGSSKSGSSKTGKGKGGRRLNGKGKGGSSKMYSCDEDYLTQEEPVDLEGDDPFGTMRQSGAGGTANFADATSTNSLEASLPSSSATQMAVTMVGGALVVCVAAVMM